MMFRKAVLFLVGLKIIATLSILVSCKDDCNFPARRTFISDLSGRLSQLVSDSLYLQFDTIANSTVAFNRFAYIIQPEIQYLSMQTAVPNFINNAYACSPLDPLPPTEKLIDLQITADKEFIAGYPAGSNLASFFHIQIDKSGSGLGNQKYELPAFLSAQHNVPLLMVLRMKSPPDVAQAFHFHISLTQAGGSFTTKVFNTGEVFIAK